MPELPEVETIRRGLARDVVGHRVVGVALVGARTVRRQSPEELAARLVGRTVQAVGRRGKYLIVELESGEWLVVHLRMSGQLLRARDGDPIVRHTHAVLALAGGIQVRFVDPRTFGELFVVDPAELAAVAPSLAAHGYDPLEDPVPAARLRALLAGRRAPIKAVLSDQRVVAGLGNIYTDEVLHRARVRFDRPAGTLTAAEVARLHRAIRSVLAQAVRLGGSSLADAQYVDVDGRPGRFQDRHRVYGREGQPCRSCGRAIVRARFGGRSTFFCPGCQV